eukprot:g16762.t1
MDRRFSTRKEHINAVVGFNVCRKLGQPEELRERAGEALRAAAARRKEEKTALAPSGSVTTGTPSSSQSEVGEVGSNGEEEAWDERRRPRREVAEDSWKDGSGGAADQQQKMYEQYLELQRYHQASTALPNEPKGDEAKDAEAKKGQAALHASGFKDFLLKAELIRAIVDCGFEHPSESTADPLSTSEAILGTDVLCQAKSGMGKTAVFVLACLQQVDSSEKAVRTLVICHTRELAYQIKHEFERFAKYFPERLSHVART